MIPTSELSADVEIDEYTQEPSLTYYIDIANGRLHKKIDDLDAVSQAALKILATELYSSIIYDDSYGIGLQRLIGKDMDFVMADLERTITDALTNDDRITGISDFNAEQISSDTIKATFTINTIFGSTTLESEVAI